MSSAKETEEPPQSVGAKQKEIQTEIGFKRPNGKLVHDLLFRKCTDGGTKVSKSVSCETPPKRLVGQHEMVTTRAFPGHTSLETMLPIGCAVGICFPNPPNEPKTATIVCAPTASDADLLDARNKPLHQQIDGCLNKPKTHSEPNHHR